MDSKIRDDKSIAMRVSVVSIIINTILSIGKVAAGVIAGSGVMEYIQPQMYLVQL